MQTFSQFVDMMENGILDVDLPADDSAGNDCLLRAMSTALKSNKSDVMAFLTRLAKQNPDIQAELDKMNHETHMLPKKKMRMGSSMDQDKDGDVIIPNSADSSHGELP